MNEGMLAVALAGIGLPAAAAVRRRLQLSRAKHPSLHGHARLSRRVARLLPYYEYDETTFFASDGAPPAVAEQRRASFDALAETLQAKSPQTIARTEALSKGVSDLQFVNTYRVPFQYRRFVMRHLKVGSLLASSQGPFVVDLDGQSSYDLTGSYGANLLGYDFYKDCVDAGIARVRELGPLLGSYHPVVEDNVERLRRISGLDEVSFHMSGTEAVMQAVRLARYHTGRSHVVQFAGAYHGWWDGVQPGIGNPRPVRDVYMLKDMDADTLRVLRTRRDIACVLVNPLQALHPNSGAPGDSTLVASDRRARFDRAGYTAWLRDLREVCTARSIPLILDEVFLGFRLAPGGAQEYFDVRADLVTYGKTLGGGLPVGVLCGRSRWMKRFRDDRPSDVCFARGTFNSHPYVMGAMNEFLRRLDDPAVQDNYARADEVWNGRASALNHLLRREDLPVQVANLSSVWTILYTTPSRYNWMFQYYLRAEGLSLSWVGSGRLIFVHDLADEHFDTIARRFVSAARAMHQAGWWWAGRGLTDKAIKRQILKEIVRARLFPPSPAPPQAASWDSRSSSSPRSRWSGAR